MISAFIKTLLFFIIFSRKSLTGKIEKTLCCEGSKFYPRFSARASLTEIVKEICSKQDRKIILVPDYICNVVVKAIVAGGAKVEFYGLNEKFEPDEAYLANRIESMDCAILLTASLYGADGGCGFIAKSSWRHRLQSTSTILLIDLCQDIYRAKTLSHFLSETEAFILVSFNNKSFPGMMGGGFLADAKLNWLFETSNHLNFKQKFTLIWRYLLLNLSSLKRKILAEIFLHKRKYTIISPEFSDCVQFPFNFVSYRIDKLQLAAGFAGLSLKNKLELKKKKNLTSFRNLLMVTQRVDMAPYVILKDQYMGILRQKAPYALNHSPDKTLRPKLIIIHNKGFNDY